MNPGALLFAVFIGLLLLNVPIAVALGIAGVVVITLKGVPMSVLAMIVYSSIAKFTLLAVPFFILAGIVMEKGGISKRLIRFANAMAGHLPGGLAIVCVLTCMFFAAISGSGPATVAALGVMMIPAMIDAGYDPGMASALMATAGAIGIIIPPSIPYVLYGVIAEQSIAKMFIAGILPGIVVGLALIIASLWEAKRHGYGGRPRASAGERWAAFKDAFWGLLTPLVILGGIYGGFFTPTEAAAVAVVYGLIVGGFVYREIKWKDLLDALIECGSSTAVVMLVVASATVFAWVITTEGVTEAVSAALLSIASTRVSYLLMTNLILLIAGCFIDAISAFYILTPILLPPAVKLGVDPILFGIMMTVNLAIGQVTPPVGVNLYVACGISKLPLKRVAASLGPWLIAAIASLILITYVPPISLWLPALMGVK